MEKRKTGKKWVQNVKTAPRKSDAFTHEKKIIGSEIAIIRLFIKSVFLHTEPDEFGPKTGQLSGFDAELVV